MRGNTVTIEVSLKRGKMAKSVPLYQYDYGQKLIFTNVELPSVYEVHFSNELHGESLTMIGDSTGVLIPDTLLTTGLPVYLWAFLHVEEDDGETEYTGVIPVIQRARPSDVEPTPEEQSVITQAIAALNAGVETVENAVENIDTTIQTSLQEAKESGLFDGADGQDGQDGQDGFTPTVDITSISGGYQMTITNSTGASVVNVMNGVDGSPGADGSDGADGQDGADGADGEDGFSPVATVTKDGATATISITDKTGTTTTTISDGEKGEKGDTGVTPAFSIGTVETVDPDSDAEVTVSGTQEEPVLNFWIPQGADGNATVDDTAGAGDTTHVWSANKTNKEVSDLKSALDYETARSIETDKIAIPVNWTQGGINDDGSIQGTTYKIRTGYVNLVPGDIVALTDLKYTLQLFKFDSDNVYIGKTDMTQLFVATESTRCRIVMQRVNTIYSILPAEGSAILFCHNANVDTAKIYAIENKTTELYTLSDLLALNGSYSFPASFYARGRYVSGYPVYDITYRAVMPNVIRLGYDAVITPVDNSFRVQVLLYNESDVFVSIEEITSAKSVPKNQGFRLSILRSQESTSEIADLYEFARAVEVSSFMTSSATGEKYVLQTVPFAEYKIDAKLYKMKNSYVSLIKPRDNFIRVANGVTVYMAVNGNDTNDGLSSAHPKKTFASATAVQNVQTIILAEGTYEAGTHFTNGEQITVPVNLIGVGNVIIKNGHFSAPITFKNSLYCENITFYWGNNAVIVQYDSYDKVATFYKCKFEKSGVNNGLYALGGLTYVIECEATNNASDGFNYHKNSSILNHAIEINCKSSFNGDGNNYSSNATTTHNGNYIVRVNGDYKCCYGGVVADQEAYSANYGCSTGISTVTDESEHADKMANYWCSSAVMYLFDCVSYGSKYDTATIGTGEIISNVEYESNYTDS